MAVTQADIDALNEGIASAERQIVHGSQSVTYRSIEDLIAARDDLQRQKDAQEVSAGTKARRIRRTKWYFAGRGF